MNVVFAPFQVPSVRIHEKTLFINFYHYYYYYYYYYYCEYYIIIIIIIIIVTYHRKTISSISYITIFAFMSML